jgi:hypothetical protein
MRCSPLGTAHYALASAVAASLLLWLCTPAHAQNTPSTTSTVEGVVYDSVRSAPLAGATVQLISSVEPSQAFSAETDSAGSFRIAQVPRGQFVIGFLHSELAELDLGAVEHRLRVDSQPVVQVSLFVPGAVAIRTALCGAPAQTDSTGTVVGFVRDADTEMPMAGAHVTAAWRSYQIDEHGLHAVPRRVEATADATGWFAICGVPSDGAFDIRASLGARGTPFVQATAPVRGLVIRDLSMGLDSAEAPAAATAAAGAPPPVAVRRNGASTLAGIVRDSAGAPLGGVQVLLPDAGASATTGGDGRFTLASVPSGTQPLVVQHVGFLPLRMAVDLRGGHAESIDVKLAERIPVLAPVNVEARKRLSKLDEFNSRRLTAQGQYFTGDDILKMGATRMSDVFRRAHALRVVRVNPNDSTTEEGIVSAHGQNSFRFTATGFCFPAVFIDGALVKDAARVINDTMDPSEVAGIEVYDDVATVPDKYRYGNCGTVLIWTHVGPGQ